ncbi:tetratricopeptide repeat protein [Sphingobacterium hungaricum]
MKAYILLQILFTLLISQASYAQNQNNAELQKMADEDQKARGSATIDWSVLNREDSIRRENVYAFYRENKVITAQDYFNAGVVMQHGNDTVASSLAVSSFKRALELDSNLNRWWYAAAVDRDLMRRNEPQIYGTQFIKTSAHGKWELYKMDATKISDAERLYYKVGTYAEQKEKERKMNLKSINQFFAQSNNIDETIQLIQQEFKKQQAADYSVDEADINNFGYQLMNNKKLEEALKIFKLNTELYPKGYNTFDSYGECLLILGKKDEAKKAYEKSLVLNPENNNAKKVLQELE